MHQVFLETICLLTEFQLHYCPDNDAKSMVKHFNFLQKLAVLKREKRWLVSNSKCDKSGTNFGQISRADIFFRIFFFTLHTPRHKLTIIKTMASTVQNHIHLYKSTLPFNLFLLLFFLKKKRNSDLIIVFHASSNIHSKKRKQLCWTRFQVRHSLW